MKIGFRLESLGLPLRAALGAASCMGVAGVQLDATADLNPKKLSATGRREIVQLLRSHGLQLTALYCPLRHGLDHAPNLEARLAHLQLAMAMSCDLGARLVIVDFYGIPQNEDDQCMATLREALIALGNHADRIGATLALQTGSEPGVRFASFLGSLPANSLRVNFDPANFLIHGFDPAQQISLLKNLIVHVHAHDAKKGSSGKLTGSLAVGAGDVDWFAVVGNLAAIEYRGWLVVKAKDRDRLAIETGVSVLKRLI
jgi:sugar phosphate isomerase/epimerase